MHRIEGCLDALLRDLRYAARSLGDSRAATLAAVVSLGIGIGTAAAVFSIGDAALFRTLDVPDAHEVVAIYGRSEAGAYTSFSHPAFEHIHGHSRSFEALAAWARLPVNAAMPESVERLSTELVSRDFFRVLGVDPALGRSFLPGEDNAVVVSWGFWQDRLGGEAAALGRSLTLNNRPFVIVGVLPRSFRSVVLDWGKPPQVWIPLAAHTIFRDLPMHNTRAPWMLVTGRLKPGSDVRQAQAEIDTLLAAWQTRTAVLPIRQARFWPGHRGMVINYIGLLAAVAALTLLMAGVSVANLMLGRAAKRGRELGIRIAIGAGRLRLARGLLIEAALVSLGGAGLGLLLAGFAPRLLDLFQNPLGLPLALDLSLDLRVAAFVLAAACLTTLLAALFPARLAWRLDVSSLVKRDAGGRLRGMRLSDGLIVAQVAICVVALAGASLFLRTLWNAGASDPMLRGGNALLAGIDLLTAGYDEPRGKAFLREALGRVRRIPGVEAAAYVKTVPLGGFAGAADVRAGDVDAKVAVNTVSDGYFVTAGFPILRGRDLEPGKTASVVVNEQMAQRFWPGEDPLGKVVALPRYGREFRVAGVVRDGRMRSFREPQVAPCVYLPVEADYQRMITMYVRTAGDPLSMAPAVRGALRELDASLPFTAGPLEAHLGAALAKERMAAAMLGGLGAFTTLLAAVGLYGLISVTVSRRAREIAIRTALGAGPARVVATVTSRFAALLAAGAALGAAASLALAPFAEPLAFGVRPADPASLASACLFLTAVAAAACAVPAWRAAFADPLQALRQD